MPTISRPASRKSARSGTGKKIAPAHGRRGAGKKRYELNREQTVEVLRHREDGSPLKLELLAQWGVDKGRDPAPVVSQAAAMLLDEILASDDFVEACRAGSIPTDPVAAADISHISGLDMFDKAAKGKVYTMNKRDLSAMIQEAFAELWRQALLDDLEEWLTRS